MYFPNVYNVPLSYTPVIVKCKKHELKMYYQYMAHAQTSSAHMSTAIVAQPQPLSISKLNWLSSSQILVVTAVSRASISGTYADLPAKIIIDPNQSYSVLNV